VRFDKKKKEGRTKNKIKKKTGRKLALRHLHFVRSGSVIKIEENKRNKILPRSGIRMLGCVSINSPVPVCSVNPGPKKNQKKQKI
jgi:hypothetical protein